MFGRKLCVLLKVLALAGAAVALLPEDLEDRAASANLQEECASKCPDLDLTQVKDTSRLEKLYNLGPPTSYSSNSNALFFNTPVA